MRPVGGNSVAGALVLAVLISVAGSPRGVAEAAVAVPVAADAEVALHPTFAEPLVSAPRSGETSVAVRPIARQADIPVNHVWQSMNNCGPASVVMLLSSIGIRVSQEEARLALRGTNELRGMGPTPVDPWLENRFPGVNAFWRNNGTPALMKTLLSNGFVPMVTQWLYDPPTRIAHWRAVRGYDEDAGVFYVADPMRGAAVPLTYKWFDDNWRPFQYRWLVVYKQEDEALLRAIVQEEWHDVPSRLKYLQRAKEEALGVNSSEAWLSYGEAAYLVGRVEESVTAFEKGMQLGSAIGVYNVRSSYPTALRMLGRETDARAVQAKLAAGTNNVTTAISASPTGQEIRIIQNAGGNPGLLYPALLPPSVQPARFPADAVPQL